MERSGGADYGADAQRLARFGSHPDQNSPRRPTKSGYDRSRNIMFHGCGEHDRFKELFGRSEIAARAPSKLDGRTWPV
jgi:hypothetical protein